MKFRHTRWLPFVTLLVLLTLGVARAQAGPWSPVNADPWSYVAPPLQGHCLESYRLFLPPAPLVMPTDGWPVLVHVSLAAGISTVDITSLDEDDLLGKALLAGIAVVAARATVSLPTDDPQWTTWCGAEPVLPGHGLFHPPGVVPPDLAAQGIAPYDDPAYAMPEKDAVMLLQHVRHLARQTGPFETLQESSMAALDHRRIAGHGSSAGANALCWSALGPDRRIELPFAGLGGQYDEATRLHVLAVRHPAMWWPMFRDDLSLPVSHFGSNGHSEDGAATMGDVDPFEKQALSPLFHHDPAWVAELPMMFQYIETSVSEDYIQNLGPACDPYPFCFDDQGLEGIDVPGGQPLNVHPSWSGFTWKTLHPQARLVVLTPEALAQANGVEVVPVLGGAAAADDDLVQWLAEQFDGLVPSQAAPAEDVLPGFKVLGVLPEDGVHSLALESVAGTVLRATCRRKAGALQPALRVVASDGSTLVPPEATVQGPKVARFKQLVLPDTDAYRVEVMGASAAGGGYRLRLKAKTPAKLSQVVTVGLGDGSEIVTFDAVAGTVLASLVVKRVKPPKGSPPTVMGQPAALLPGIGSLVGPDAQPIDLSGLTTTSASGKTLKAGPVTLTQTGTYTLTVAGAGGSVGYGRVTLRLKRPKGKGVLAVP